MIKKDDVEYMANLARIDLDEGEKESLQKDLSDIIGYIDRLKELDISDVLSLDHSIMVGNVTREDIKVDYDERRGLIDNFTENDKNYLKVRQIL